MKKIMVLMFSIVGLLLIGCPQPTSEAGGGSGGSGSSGSTVTVHKITFNNADAGYQSNLAYDLSEAGFCKESEVMSNFSGTVFTPSNKSISKSAWDELKAVFVAQGYVVNDTDMSDVRVTKSSGGGGDTIVIEKIILDNKNDSLEDEDINATKETLSTLFVNIGLFSKASQISWSGLELIPDSKSVLISDYESFEVKAAELLSHFESDQKMVYYNTITKEVTIYLYEGTEVQTITWNNVRVNSVSETATTAGIVSSFAISSIYSGAGSVDFGSDLTRTLEKFTALENRLVSSINSAMPTGVKDITRQSIRWDWNSSNYNRSDYNTNKAYISIQAGDNYKFSDNTSTKTITLTLNGSYHDIIDTTGEISIFGEDPTTTSAGFASNLTKVSWQGGSDLYVDFHSTHDTLNEKLEATKGALLGVDAFFVFTEREITVTKVNSSQARATIALTALPRYRFTGNSTTKSLTIDILGPFTDRVGSITTSALSANASQAGITAMSIGISDTTETATANFYTGTTLESDFKSDLQNAVKNALNASSYVAVNGTPSVSITSDTRATVIVTLVPDSGYNFTNNVSTRTITITVTAPFIRSSTKTFYVNGNANGNNINRNGTSSSPFGTMQRAIQVIDAISSSGTYTIYVVGTLNGSEARVDLDPISSGYTLTIKGSSSSSKGVLDNDSQTNYRLITKDSATGNLTLYLENLVLKEGGRVTYGGAIYMANFNRLYLQTGVQIYNNRATTYGGGVYVTNGDLFMSGGDIQLNSVSYADSCGGGIYIGAGSEFTMTGGSILANTANNTTNSGEKGGGVYLADNTTMTMSGGNIGLATGPLLNGATGGRGNLSDYGGGIYVENGARLNLSANARIRFNNAHDAGGGVRVDERGSVYVNNSKYTGSGGSFVLSNTNGSNTSNITYN